jgi:hypothetical protein
MGTVSGELQEFFDEVDRQAKGKKFSEAEILIEIQKYRKEKRTH